MTKRQALIKADVRFMQNTKGKNGHELSKMYIVALVRLCLTHNMSETLDKFIDIFYDVSNVKFSKFSCQ